MYWVNCWHDTWEAELFFFFFFEVHSIYLERKASLVFSCTYFAVVSFFHVAGRGVPLPVCVDDVITDQIDQRLSMISAVCCGCLIDVVKNFTFHMTLFIGFRNRDLFHVSHKSSQSVLSCVPISIWPFESGRGLLALSSLRSVCVFLSHSSGVCGISPLAALWARFILLSSICH